MIVCVGVGGGGDIHMCEYWERGGGGGDIHMCEYWEREGGGEMHVCGCRGGGGIKSDM